MKETYTDEELQKAIDHAFRLASVSELTTIFQGLHWSDEKQERLTIATSFLEALQHDPYAELKKAHAEGKMIQFTDDAMHSGVWVDCKFPLWKKNDDSDFVNPRYRIKPTPSTFDAHGKTWTPAIGDVVQLKSGGPKMTIHFLDTKNAGCVTFSSAGEFTFATLPQACLIPVTTDNSSKVKS